MADGTARRRQLLMLAPFGAAIAVGAGFWEMLAGMNSGRFDPHDIHAPAQGRRVPAFDLPAQPPGQGFSSAELSAQRQPVLVNFFASWCVPCVVEGSALVGLSRRLPIWGIAYKDKPADAQGFVSRTGSPYRRLAADRSGMTAIDWGVSGVPESFLIAPGGLITWHIAGPLDEGTIEAGLLPALRKLA